MTFFKTTQLLSKENITIINVGSYKVRAVICSFSFNEIKILGYGEKRQSRLDVINNEINNISGICETIKQSILKAELQAGVSPKKIIVNPFFTNTFFSSKKINHKQKDNDKNISKNDIFKIINSVEKISIASTFNEILNKFGIQKDDLRIILGSISEISIDNEITQNLLGKHGEDIHINILNAFIPKMNYQIIQDVAHFLGKNVFKIIPEEFSVIKTGKKDKMITFINIGNSSTFISIKNKDNSLAGSIKLDIGISDLVKSITKNSDKSRSAIIKKLDRNDLFTEEKNAFLSIFTDLITAGLKEILQSEICPYRFTITGGGASNNFIKECISKIDFHSFGIKILKKPKFISPAIDEIKKIQGVENILEISNINLISQIITTHKILQSDNDLIEQALQKSMKNILQVQ